MKKLTLLWVALLTTTMLFAETVKIEGLYYSLGTTTAQVVADQSSDKSVYSAYTEVTIPASITYGGYTYPVTSIGASAFVGLTNLQSVSLPSSITSIGTYAFEGCTSLKEVNLPEGITTINQRAFYNCNLDTIVIPRSLAGMGNKTFYANPLKSITWNADSCEVGTGEDSPFYSTNSQITSFTFGEDVKMVPAYICYKMTKLDTIVLPPSVRRLGEHAFYGCSALKSINLPATQKTLPVSIFEACTALERIELPATLTTINTDAFYGCTSLKEVNLPEGLTTINLRAFYKCNLDTIVIPSTVTSIGDKAFQSNPTKAVTWMPKNCSISTTSQYGPFYSDKSAITSFTFGDSVQVIPGYLCQSMNVLDTIVLPPTVTSIGNDAFYGCAQLKDVVIPESVQAISQRAFMYCSSFKKITLPKGLKTIATSVFEGCTYLEQVVIPSSVTAINQDAFYNCQSLNAIYNYATTPQTIVERTVKNVNKQTCVLYVPMDYLDLYQAKAVWCDFLNIVGMATEMTFEEKQIQLTYLQQDSSLYYMEVQNWQVPKEPYINGFTFVGWQIQPGYLADGIVLRAVYEANSGTDAPAVYTNPENPAQKLIRDGNVYILRDDKIYTIQGQSIK